MLDNEDMLEILWFLKALSVEIRGLDRETVFMGNNSLLEFERKFDIMIDKLNKPNK